MRPNYVMLLVFFFAVVSVSSHGSFIGVDLEYDRETQIFSLNRTALFEDSYLPGGIRATSEYTYVLQSVNGSTLSEGYIVIPGPVIREHSEDEPAELLFSKTVKISLYLPYDSKLGQLRVNSDSNELLRVDLMEYNRCNLNRICEEKENLVICPEDCQDSNRDGICILIEDGICLEDSDCPGRDPDCIISEYNSGQDLDESEMELEEEEQFSGNETAKEQDEMSINKSDSLLYAVGIVILLLLFFILYRMKRNT